VNRRDIIKGGAAALVVAAVPSLAASPDTAVAMQPVSTGGIGLSRRLWEQAHGQGMEWQNVVYFEDGTYTVQFAEDVVVYVELEWIDEGGITRDEAKGLAMPLLPSDAELTEVYDAPPTIAGPVGIRTERYHSPALANLMKQVEPSRTGAILVVYQEGPAEDQSEPKIVLMSLAVGSKPRSILDEKSGLIASFA
jgi:hypothetical protein